MKNPKSALRIMHHASPFTFALLFLSTLNSQLSTGFAQGTAFTYQGRLNEISGPANGSYDFTFQVFDAPSYGASQSAVVTASGVSVTDGLLTVMVDFGVSPFSSGAPRWLEIAARPSGGGSFGMLTPRQALTGTPYAITAGSASNLLGTLSAGQLTGTIAPANIGAGTISSTMLAAGSVTSTQLAADSVTSAQLAAGSVTTTSIAEDTIPASKLQLVPQVYDITTVVVTQRIAGVALARVEADPDQFLVGGGMIGSGSNAVQVCYYVKTDGSFFTLTNPAPQAGSVDDFGGAIALLNATDVIIGSPLVDFPPFATNYGFVGVFRGTAGIGAFALPTANGDRFGSAIVVLSPAGVAISAPGEDQVGITNCGAVYMFGTNAAVGTNLLFSFVDPSPVNGGAFGTALARVGNNDLVVGAPGKGGSHGEAYRYSSSGSLLATFTNPLPSGVGQFGKRVAAFDQDRVLIAAPGSGRAHLFRLDGTLLATLTNQFTSLADQMCPVDYDKIAVLGNDDQIHVYSTNGTFLSSMDDPDYSFATDGRDRLLALRPDLLLVQNQTVSVNTLRLWHLDRRGLDVSAKNVGLNSVATVSLQDGAVTADKLNPSIGVWTKLGTNISYAAGNVGIGTTTPTSELDVNGTITASGIQGNGSGLTLGTTDNQPLELKVNNTRALRIEPNANGAPNVIGGAVVNYVAAGVVGATISGGGAAIYAGQAKTNYISSDFGTIAGGDDNHIADNSDGATIAGGSGNGIGTASGASAIGGGLFNRIADNSGGATIAGGILNHIGTNSAYSMIIGGYNNNIADNSSYAFAAGRRAKANHAGTFVWADSADVDFASASPNQFLIRASGGVGIGTASPAAQLDVRGDVVLSGHLGIGTTAPAAKLDVRGDVKVSGDVNVSGDVKMGSTNQIFAMGGEENLRIIRGNVIANGTVAEGAGFTATLPTNGHYVVTFSTPFTARPSVTASVADGSSFDIISVHLVDALQFKIGIFDPVASAFTNRDFEFIAVGPR